MLAIQGNTIPKLFLSAAKQRGDQVALRHKEYGVWRVIRWDEYLRHVQDFALALRQLGVQTGDRIAVIAENVPEWLYADLAIQSCRAMALGIFADSTREEIEYYLKKARVKFVIAGDQEQADKMLDLRESCPFVERCFVIDMKGLATYQDPFIMSWADAEELGGRLAAEQSGLFEDMVAATREADAASLVSSSGTTGKPKLGILSQRNLVRGATAFSSVYPFRKGDEYLSHIPMAWFGERMISLRYNILENLTVNFPEDMDSEVVLKNMREIMPNIIFGVPRLWEGMASSVFIRIEKAAWIKRFWFNLMYPIGMRHAALEMSYQPVPFWLRVLYRIADWTLFLALRHRLGLAYMRVPLSGGGALGPDVFRFFHAMGVRLKNVYGQTETSGIAVMQRPEDLNPEIVGKPLPGYELRVTDEGEILIRGDACFEEYWEDPEATAKAKRDGWIHTGDQGYLDEEGNLVIMDRQRYIVTLPNGELFSPQKIENKLKFSRYIKEAIVVAEGRAFVAALIQIDLETVGHWAERRGFPYTTFRDLAQKPQVYQLIGNEIARVNRDLSPAAQVKNFLLLDKELDPDDEELTRTGKIRREYVLAKFSEEIERVYDTEAAQLAAK